MCLFIKRSECILKSCTVHKYISWSQENLVPILWDDIFRRGRQSLKINRLHFDGDHAQHLVPGKMFSLILCFMVFDSLLLMWLYHKQKELGPKRPPLYFSSQSHSDYKNGYLQKETLDILFCFLCLLFCLSSLNILAATLHYVTLLWCHATFVVVKSVAVQSSPVSQWKRAPVTRLSVPNCAEPYCSTFMANGLLLTLSCHSFLVLCCNLCIYIDTPGPPYDFGTHDQVKGCCCFYFLYIKIFVRGHFALVAVNLTLWVKRW